MTNRANFSKFGLPHADVVELVDTLDSGSSACKGMKVQVLSSALKNRRSNSTVFYFPSFQLSTIHCLLPTANCLLFTTFACMENFDDFFTEAFETATLKGNLVTLRGVRENAPGEASAENIFKAIEGSRDFLNEHLPWIQETDIFDLKKRIRSWVLNERFGQGGCWLIFKNTPDSEEGIFAGSIMMEVNIRNHSATLSYWLAKPFTGQGLMTESVKLIIKFAFEHLKLNRVELLVSVHNGKSAAVATRCGFMEEGINRDYELINGKFVDHRRFSLLARDVY